MKNIGRLGTTVLGVYLIAIGVVPYVLPSAVVLDRRWPSWPGC